MDLPLPIDIFVNIFSRLHIKDLIRCRCVSKTWHNELSSSSSNPHLPKLHLALASQSPDDPTFILYSHSYDNILNTQLHYLQLQPSSSCLQQHHPIRIKFPLDSWFNKFSVVGSCNGLLCLSDISISPSHDMYIFNPCTGDYAQVPHCGYGEHFVFGFGFGFDSSAEEYKVVRIKTDTNFLHFPTYRLNVSVYTLGDPEWRDVGVGDFRYCIDPRSPSVNVNGGLHWKCYEKVDHHEYLASVACFEVGSEEFRIIQFPDFVNELDLADKVSLVTLGGSLCFYRTTLHMFSWYRITIWVMKDYGVKESWAKQFVIKDSMVFKPYIEYAIPFFLSNDNEILLICAGKQLVAYDPERKSFRELGFYGTLDPSMVVTHVGTLIPPTFDNQLRNRH